MAAALTALALSRLLGPWNTGTGPAYRELADVVRLLILDGRIPLDTALPSERSGWSTVNARWAGRYPAGCGHPGSAAARHQPVRGTRARCPCSTGQGDGTGRGR